MADPVGEPEVISDDVASDWQRNAEYKPSPTASTRERQLSKKHPVVHGRVLPVPLADVGVTSSSSYHSLSNQSGDAEEANPSAASSINDLTFEAEQLERAVRHNDMCYVRRMLELHHNKFAVNLHGSLLDKSSSETRSHCISQDVDILLRKSQTFLDRLDRHDSISTEQETPPIFSNALHLAVEYNSQDVARLLLKYGVDPNECGVSCGDVWRRSSYTAPVESSPAETRGRRFSQLLTPAAARHCTDGRGSPIFLPRQLVHLRRDISEDARTVYFAHDGHRVGYDDVYTRDALYALPPLFLGVVLGNPGIVHILLKYGASPNVQDKYGVTPLHLAACVERTPCLRLLLEAGARCQVKNQRGISPNELADQSLVYLQTTLVEEAMSSFTSSTDSGDEDVTATGTCRTTIFRRFQDNRSHHRLSRRKEYLSVDSETARASPEGVSCSSHHSSSRHSNRSIQSASVSHGDDEKEKNHEYEVNLRTSYKKTLDDSRGRNRSQATFTGDIELRVSRAENSLHILSKMATNSECLVPILTCLQCHLPAIIELCDHVEGNKLHKPVAVLMNQLLQTIVDDFHHPREGPPSLNNLTISVLRLQNIALGCIRGGHSLQYTSLLILNKIIDVTTIHGIALHEIDRLDDPTSTDTILNVLIEKSTDLILNVLNNAITLHKRVIGSRQLCTPSKRWRNCNYHCLQMLSARAILYLSQEVDAQKKLLEEGHLKILIAALDSTHDPQLLCLVLQIVATLALEPRNHSLLLENELPDSLTQLVLPSDEWYYTNHSTKYARYVKHHAARVLVYLGLEQRLKNKVYLYDLIEDPLPPHMSMVTSEEDNYIMQTSIAPSVVTEFGGRTLGISVETVVMEMVKDVEVRRSPEGL